MNCKECKPEIANLFESNVDEAVYAEVMEHIQHCAECSEDYDKTREVFALLKPKFQPKTPIALKQNIINRLKMEEKIMKQNALKKNRLNHRTRRFMYVAAVLILIMTVVPIVDKNSIFTDSAAKAANVLIESSIKATQLIKSMVIKLKVRTVAHDNFELVGTEYGMVDHTIWKLFDEPEKWRIEKGERIVVNDGKFQYLWLPQFNEGIKAGTKANFIEWFKILLEPEKILLKEQSIAKLRSSKVNMTEKNGEVYLSVTSIAQGNFINDYCKNKSIDESDNRREYVFDAKTKLLKGLKIFILNGKKDILILEIEKISYNVQIDSSLFKINLPKGVEWKELNQNSDSERFKNISSKRVAELFFEGMANNDWKIVEEACDFFKNNSEKVSKIKEEFGGLKVISIGEPFKSGLYHGEFVPYEIKFKSGEIKKFNLAVRNDNPNKVWIVDGGY